MWTVEVHDECMQQSMEDEREAAKARKYGNSIPRHNCHGSAVSVIGRLSTRLQTCLSVLLASALATR
jgi:hypothetical protein